MGDEGAGPAMVVVVAMAVPCSVPVRVRLPLVDAEGRKLRSSVTVPDPLPTRVAFNVQLWPAVNAPSTLEVNEQPLLLQPVTLKFVVLVTVLEPVTAWLPASVNVAL